MAKLVYFAWVRERIGKSEEVIELDPAIVTVSDLLAYLKTRGEEYQAALEYQDVIRVALDQEHVEHDASIKGVTEIALFPPMTGG
jgi:molybdopterin synthase sulfur carrier subunit